MKPLTIFERHPAMDAYRVGGSFTPYAIIATDKRFTEAELAAECWRAEADWRNAYRSAPMPGIGQWEHNQFAAHDRNEALERFATLPHYDEAEE